MTTQKTKVNKNINQCFICLPVRRETVKKYRQFDNNQGNKQLTCFDNFHGFTLL